MWKPYLRSNTLLLKLSAVVWCKHLTVNIFHSQAWYGLCTDIVVLTSCSTKKPNEIGYQGDGTANYIFKSHSQYSQSVPFTTVLSRFNKPVSARSAQSLVMFSSAANFSCFNCLSTIHCLSQQSDYHLVMITTWFLCVMTCKIRGNESPYMEFVYVYVLLACK